MGQKVGDFKSMKKTMNTKEHASEPGIRYTLTTPENEIREALMADGLKRSKSKVSD